MIKVAGIQMDLAWGQPERNLASAAALIRAARGADLVVLPEMFATGFIMDPVRASAARLETEREMAALARELGIHICLGTAELLPGDAEGRGCNVALMLGPDGLVGRYEKIHPFTFAGEDNRYRGGERLCVVEVRGIRVGVFICYDLRFPEVFRAAASQVDLMLVLANWPEPRRHAWRSLLVARAIECQCYVLGVNRVGEGGGLRYVGDSMFVDPLGEVLGSAAVGPACVGGLVDGAVVADIRQRFPFLGDRRPDVYSRL